MVRLFRAVHHILHSCNVNDSELMTVNEKTKWRSAKLPATTIVTWRDNSLTRIYKHRKYGRGNEIAYRNKLSRHSDISLGYKLMDIANAVTD